MLHFFTNGLLNTFPGLLSYGFGSYFFAPALIRITVASVFLYLTFTHFKTKKTVSDELTLPRVSHEIAVWGAGLLLLAELALAFALFFGAWTQIASILAGLACIKAIILKKKFPAVYPLNTLSYLLLAIMCLMLLISGAGAFAFDLPL